MNPPFGTAQPCFIIAEVGVNHNGDMALAHQLIQVAKDAGADAVKFQTFRAEALASADAPLADYMHKPGETATSQIELLRRLEFNQAQFAELKAACDHAGILFMSTPFDEDSADMLVALGMTVMKVPSGELTNLPFLHHLARTGLPVILSTGMGTLPEIQAALDTLEQGGAGPIAILHCVSAYPTPPEHANLRAMDTIAAEFNRPVGFSDHTLGLPIAFAAVARGACIIEKHITLDRSLPGPDHAASLEPGELNQMVSGIRAIESAFGTGVKEPQPIELGTRDVARRSIVLAHALPAGHTLTLADLTLRRPGTGLPPSALSATVGRTLAASRPAGHRLASEDLTP